jgi:hypothetical protein
MMTYKDDIFTFYLWSHIEVDEDAYGFLIQNLSSGAAIESKEEWAVYTEVNIASPDRHDAFVIADFLFKLNI